MIIILNVQGTGKYQKAVADYLTELKIVSGKGKIETYGPETQCHDGFSTNDILAAAKVNLGLFGIAVEYTFKVKPLRYVLVDVIMNKVSEVFSAPEKIKVHNTYNYVVSFIVMIRRAIGISIMSPYHNWKPVQ